MSLGTHRAGRAVGVQNFSDADIQRLLDAIEQIKPVGQEGWLTVQDIYNAGSVRSHRPEREWSSLREKWNRLVRHTKPSGDPCCPPVSRIVIDIFEVLLRNVLQLVRRAKVLNRELEKEAGLEVLDDAGNSHQDLFASDNEQDVVCSQTVPEPQVSAVL